MMVKNYEFQESGITTPLNLPPFPNKFKFNVWIKTATLDDLQLLFNQKLSMRLQNMTSLKIPK